MYSLVDSTEMWIKAEVELPQCNNPSFFTAKLRYSDTVICVDTDGFVFTDRYLEGDYDDKHWQNINGWEKDREVVYWLPFPSLGQEMEQ